MIVQRILKPYGERDIDLNRGMKRLKTESLLVLVFAGFLATVFYLMLNSAGNTLLDEYFQNSSYISHSNEKCLNKFESFVKQESIKLTDTEKIKSWLQKQKMGYVALAISQHEKILFDSLNDQSEEEVASFYRTGASRNISFSGESATVYLSGYFDYQYYVKTTVVEAILSILLFLGIFVKFVQKKIDYIIQLEKEIKILETGCLDYEITIKGSDELASLAQGLNEMRISLLENMQKEEAAAQANNNLVVSVSHDLRTPLTALLLYLDVLQKSSFSNREQYISYLEKARTKATQIKRMSDQLFQRFLLSEEEKLPPNPVQKARFFFEDMLSDMSCYLTQHDFNVETKIQWPNANVSLMFDYVNRILDNVSSNIIKYADAQKTVTISLLHQEGWLVLQFSNEIVNKEKGMDSTGVGVQNICTMMEEMGCKCLVNQNNQNYVLELWFQTV